MPGPFKILLGEARHIKVPRVLFGGSDIDNYPNRFVGHPLIVSLPSHPGLHAEQILCQRHIPRNCWGGRQPQCWSGAGSSPFLERMTHYVCAHTQTRNLNMSPILHMYQRWIFWTPFHILIILKILPFMPNLAHLCDTPSASPISYCSLCGLIFPYKSLYTVPWLHANFTADLIFHETIWDSKQCFPRVFRKAQFSFPKREGRPGKSWPLPSKLPTASIFFFVWERASCNYSSCFFTHYFSRIPFPWSWNPQI